VTPDFTVAGLLGGGGDWPGRTEATAKNARGSKTAERFTKNLQIELKNPVKWVDFPSVAVFCKPQSLRDASRWQEQNQSKRALNEYLKGGFFLRKKPLVGCAPGYSYSDFAIAAVRESAIMLALIDALSEYNSDHLRRGSD
jgi:hypothetical protein